ncbi:uncharacterized protein N7473_007038 [Penicillium subrubescens]|nr:uncharacterized protein N7473_007038 [Penicillium subrubescens]KAJ5890810.1 hypothetical protein N7473_007038 [Penicillium subrubescens]
MVHPDTDIFSTLTSMHLSVPHEDDRLIQDSYDQGMNAFKAMDSQHGVVRHATFIESHYRCFFVTRDNVATMLQSTDQPATQTLARQIITQLHEIPLLISWACLNMMEEQWTGRTRMPRFYHLDETKFYASVTYSSFLMPDWVQVRELVVIAVAQDAFECLATAAKYSRISASMPPPVEQGCDMEVVKDLVTKLRAGNARHTLLAAIKRKCLRFAGEGSSVYLVPSNGVSRDIVHYLYNYFKKGRMPPQEPFMNISTSSDQTNLATSSKEPFDFGGLNVSEDGCVLVYATGHNHDPGRRKMSSICIFFTDGPPDLPTTERLGTVIKHTYENYDVYHTSRIHRAPNYRELGKKKKEEGNRWNIRNSYGVFSEGFHFLHWLAVLECPLPVRQGSPRDGVLWAPVFSRHHFPWREPGYIYMDLAERVFVIYKTVIQEVHYWRSVARERRARGIECCEICAFEETMAEGKGICRECEFELCEIRGEDWFRRALLGDRPIDYRPIDTEIEGEGYKRLRIPDDEMRDLNAKFERTLSFYEDLDEEFEDLGQLEAQTARFVAIHRELERYFPRKRKRSPTIVPSETE